MSSIPVLNVNNVNNKIYLPLTNHTSRQSGYLLFLTMMYLTVMLCSGVLTHRIIQLGPFYTMAGTLVAPLWFFLSDLITEVYGYRIAKKILWFGFFCQLIFALICNLLIKIPSPDLLSKQMAYVTVLDSMLRTCASAFAAYIIGGSLNIYFVSRWKILLSGKNFGLRSLGATTIAELIFTILAVFLIQIGKLPLSNILIIIVVSYSLKVIFAFLLAFPANLIANFIKQHDQIDVYDENINYNPFRIND
ncbi:MAG: queuosine precursor transporter [Gammaproteobacteria bacterium]|nr:queuosine precursor transporter [Gammaproteobacteria bacterium]